MNATAKSMPSYETHSRRLADEDDLDTYDIVYRTLCGWAGNGKARNAASVSEFAERLTSAITTR